MRILIKMDDVKKQYIDYAYNKLSGFIYSLLKKDFSSLHDKKDDYKFFCFSNIFGDSQKYLIISSPLKKIITSLYEQLMLKKKHEDVINIGEMQFRITDVQPIDIVLPRRNIHIVSSTPIIIRIPEQKYDEYQIPEKERKRRYVYWRPHYPFHAFLKQLSENLIKKYNHFYKTYIQNIDIFEQFSYKKTVYNKLFIHGEGHKFAATMWEFEWSYVDDFQYKLIKFGLDTGFGERNTMGFGFVNLKK